MKSTRLKIFLAIVSFFVLPAQSVQAKPSDEIVGVYWSPQKDAKIEIYQKDKRFFGKLVWLAKPKKDIHNPVKTLRNRDVLGVEILTGFSYSDGVYNGSANERNPSFRIPASHTAMGCTTGERYMILNPARPIPAK